jgi:hypothetical protein
LTSDNPQLPTTITLPDDWDLQVTFGQFKGMTVREVFNAQGGPAWILWAFDNVEYFHINTDILVQCQFKVDAQRIANTYRGLTEFDQHWISDEEDGPELYLGMPFW